MRVPMLDKGVYAAVLAFLCLPGHAQVQRSGGGEAQKLMQQYQQLAGEKTALQTQLAQMKKDLDAARAESAAFKKERDVLKARAGGAAAAAATAATLAQLKSSKESAERNVEVSKQRMTELVARFRETATNLKETEAERGKLRTELEARNAAFDLCADHNQQLYDINGEILKRYEHVGLFTRAAAAEPFTQITRNRLDNLVTETHIRAEELRVKARTP